MPDEGLEIIAAQPVSQPSGPESVIRLISVRFRYHGYGPFSMMINQENFDEETIETELDAFLQELDKLRDGIPELTNISIIHREGPTGPFEEHLNAEFKVNGYGPFSRFVLLRPLDTEELLEKVFGFRQKLLRVLRQTDSQKEG